MTKFKKSLLIFGILVLIIGAALGTFIVLSLTGSLKADAIALEFTVDNAEKEYDGEPLKASGYSLTEGYLIDGHMPIVTFTGEQIDTGIGFSGLDVKIVNESGYDVSKEYKIRIVEGILTVKKCSLQVGLLSQDAIYDGTTVDIGNGYTVSEGKLAAGHNVSLRIKNEWFESSGKIVAGKSLTAGDVEPLIVDINGRNVTGNYNITLAGKVNVVKRPIVVAPVSAEKTYDGRPLTCSQHIIESGSLAAGHYIVPEYTTTKGDIAQVTNANSEDPLVIIVNVRIFDLSDDDVTENYDWRTDSGTLTVNRANLTIVTKSASWVYNGRSHSITDRDPAYAIGLATGDKIEVYYTASVKDVSVVTNAITDDDYSITDDNGANKKDNYIVTVQYGTLEITRAPLTVTLQSLQKEYGGDFTSNGDLYTLSGDTDDIEFKVDDDYLHSLLDSITAIGNSTYTINSFTIFNSDDEDITAMYNVTVIPGNVTVTHRKVSFKSDNLAKTYDGNFMFTEDISLDRLVKGHKLESVTFNPISSENAGKECEATLYSLVILDEQGNNVTGNYNVTNFTEAVKVTVGKRDLTISTDSFTKEYDGEPLYGGSVTHSLLASGNSLYYEALKIVTVPESAENKPTVLAIYDSNGNDVTGFYNLDESYGKLTILKKQVTVYFEDNFEVEYSANLHNNNVLYRSSYLSGNFKCDEATEGFAKYIAIEDVEYYEFGRYEVKFKWDNTADEKILNNYELITGNNVFDFVRRKHSLILSGSKTFDNNPLTHRDLLDILNKANKTNHGVTESEEELAKSVSSNLLGKVDAATYDDEIIYIDQYDQYIAKGSYTINVLKAVVKVKPPYESRPDELWTVTYNGTHQQPTENRLAVKELLEEDNFADTKFVVNRYTLTQDAIYVKSYKYSTDPQRDYSLKFKSIEIVDPDTGKPIGDNNIKIDFEKSYVEMEIKQIDLDIKIETFSGTLSGILALNDYDLFDSIIVSNLAEGDVIKYFKDGKEITGEVNDATSQISGKGLISVDIDGSVLSKDVKIRIYRGNIDVTANYNIPTEVTGKVVY